MGLKIPYEIKCTCQKTFMAKVCKYVFTDYDPDLKNEILSGKFNFFTCPKCGQKIYAETRFLYRDEINQLWIWVFKEKDKNQNQQILEDIINNKAFIETHHIDNYEAYSQYIVFGINELLNVLVNEDESVKNFCFNE